MKKLTLALLLCASTALLSLAARPAVADVAQDVATLMQQMRNDESINSKAVDAAPPREVLTELWKYLNDPSENVRWYTMALARGIAYRSADQSLRQEAVELVLTGIEAEPLPALVENIASRLLTLPRSAFSGRAKAILARLMSRPQVEPKIVRLAGVANLYTLRTRIQELAGSPGGAAGSSRSIKEAALWALARMGDKAALQSLIATVEAAPSPLARTSLLGDLAYTRQPEAVAVLVRYLLGEERLPNFWSETAPGPLQAGYALAYLAGIIEGFPFRSDPGGYTMEEIEQARQWVQQRGVANLRIKD